MAQAEAQRRDLRERMLVFRSMDLRRTTASEELFRVLRDQILAGRYEAGEKLPPQRALATEYALNATTVREAIKRLEQLRLEEVRHGDAMRVADRRTTNEPVDP